MTQHPARPLQTDLLCAPFVALFALLGAELLRFGTTAFDVFCGALAQRLIPGGSGFNVDWSLYARDIEGLQALGALILFELVLLCAGLLAIRLRRAEHDRRWTANGREIQ
jgi:hypothetical protein